jgi:arsenate reductase
MKRVLFIDVRNATRSQIAEAWFNHLARGWGQAQSCGTMPANAIDPRAVLAMSEVGVDIRRRAPKPISQQLLGQARIVVLMGKDIHPRAFSPTYVWNFKDLTGKPMEEMRWLRDQIREHVQELIEEMQLEELDQISTEPEWQSLMHIVLSSQLRLNRLGSRA